MTLPDEMKLLVEIEPAGILRMAAIDHIDEGAHAPLRLAFDQHVAPSLAIDHGDLLARTQVGDGLGACHPVDAVGNPAARSAEIEAEHQAGLLRRAAMD